MKYDFDKIIDRKNTSSLKHDFAMELGMPEDAMPFWIADMDIQTPPQVIEALVDFSSQGIFGYTETKKHYFEVLEKWFDEKFSWNVREEWLVKTPGVIYAIHAAIRGLTKEGDSVLIQQPVYHPFSSSVLNTGRKLVNNPLVYSQGTYSMDFKDFEEKIIKNDVKMFLLCSPHNPVGRVWTLEELTKLGDICVKHGVIVVADEIHADFIFKGNKHWVFEAIKPEFADITITCTSPSKTFNLAGLQISNIFISNANIRDNFIKEIKRTGYSQPSVLGVHSCIAAYEKGSDWVEPLVEYISGNVDFLRGFLSSNIPQIKLVEPQGTYLMWLDFSGLSMTEEEQKDFVINKAKLWLDVGTKFGKDGAGFWRINIACPRSQLAKGLETLKVAVNELGLTRK